MDKIQLVIEESKNLTGVDFKSYDISVYLNDKRIPHNLFNTSHVMPIYEFNYGTFDLFTCSCGVAGCAGYQSSVIHTVKEGVVTWIFPEEDEYTTEKKVYCFNQEEFNSIFSKAIEKMLKLEKKKHINAELIRDPGTALNDNYEKKTSLKKALKWYRNNYQIEQDFKELIEKEFPEMVNHRFNYEYKGEEGNYPYEFGELICHTMREHPSRRNNKSYNKRTIQIGKMIIDFMNGKKDNLIEVIKDNYEEEYDDDLEGEELDTAHRMICADLPNVKKEEFDITQLTIKKIAS